MGALWTAICAVTVMLAACSKPSTIPVAGAVLQAGQSIEAVNRFGSVRVSYISAREREFEWDGKSRVVKMIARPEPFLAERGLYNPARCFVLVTPLCQMPRLVVREAVHDFDSYDQLYAFLGEGRETMDWTYTSDGLLVGFSRSPGRQQVNVDVRELTVRGHRPTQLRGARNQNIQLTSR